MKIRPHHGVVVCAPLALLAVSPAAQAGLTGWQRSVDWVPGVSQGSTQNNPGPVGGVPIWQYETTHGGGLGSQNPWYANAGALMTWDTNWYQTKWSVWSAGDDINPPILAPRMVHNVHTTTFDNIPLVRWRSPLGDGARIDLNGSLTVNWNGVNGLGRPVDVDVVIARISPENPPLILYSTTLAKPHPFPSVGDQIILPVHLSNVIVNAGDSVVFTERGHNAVGPLGCWVNLYDNIAITPVPAPGAAGMLILGGVLAARRRRG